MIEKLSKDQKADWPKNLPELVHAYNSMTMLTHQLLFPYEEGHRETPDKQL